MDDAGDPAVPRTTELRARHPGRSRSRGVGIDPVRIYLDEIGHWSLLDRVDESRLGEAVRAGIDAGRRLASGEVTDEAEDTALRRHVAEGERARAEFAEANLRLVVSIAKRYLRPGVELLDLVQAGNIGLLRAVERFDWRLGNRFSTYATWWIRQAIIREVGESGRSIRLPVHLREQVVALACARDRLRSELGHEPLVEEVGADVGLPLDRVEELLALGENLVSLSLPVGDGEDGELADFLSDEKEIDPAETAAARSERAEIRALLSHLSAHQAHVLRLRYGLDGSPPRSLEEVGAELDISRERVRQLEARALRRLRDDATARSLRRAG